METSPPTTSGPLATDTAHRLVATRRRVQIIDLEDAHFGLDREILLPDARIVDTDPSPERITGLAVVKTVLEFAEAHPAKKLLIAGHTDTTGSASHNLALSGRRARNTELLIRGERELWAHHCRENQEVADYQAILKWIHGTFGIECHPGPVDDQLGDLTRGALDRFRTAYNRTAVTPISENGAITTDDWRAFYDMYDRALAFLLGCETSVLGARRAKVAFVDPGILACGEHWPLERVGVNGFESATNRRVDLLFFDAGETPALDDDPPGKSIYGSRRFRTEYIPVVPSPLSGFRLVSLTYDMQFLEQHFPYVEGATAFEVSIKSLFGDEIPEQSIHALQQHVLNDTLPPPQIVIANDLGEGVLAAYGDRTIRIAEELVRGAVVSPEERWQLYLVLTEELGHYLDDLLRNEFEPQRGGDADGDEGTLFAAFYTNFNRFLFRDFSFGEIGLKEIDGDETRTIPLELALAELGTEERAKALWRAQEESSDHGVIVIDGEETEVEFFKIEGQGAVHEQITKEAAQAAGVTFDYRLDRGVAWPDVPTHDDQSPNPSFKTDKPSLRHMEYNTPDTDYAGMLTNYKSNPKHPAFKSHNGELQFWHAMSPGSHLTNREVRQRIIEQHEKWYAWALANHKFEAFADPSRPNLGKGLFHFGKILHTVQDSFSHSHTIRTASGVITSFQDYTKQDEDKHAVADKKKFMKAIHDIPGVLDAIHHSTKLLEMFRDRKPFSVLRKYLIDEVFVLSSSTIDDPSGEVLPEFEP